MRLHDPAADLCRPALADLDRAPANNLRRRLVGWPGCRPFLVVGAGRLAAARHPRRAGWLLAAVGARLLLRGVTPGDLPARRQDPPAALAGRAAGRRARAPPTSPARPGCRRLRPAARAPGSGTDVDLHSIPPVTGLLTLGDGCSVEPEVDLPATGSTATCCTSGTVAVGAERPGRRPQHAVPGARRRRRGRGRARVGGVRRGPGRASTGPGSPAERVGAARGPWVERPRRRTGPSGGVGVRRRPRRSSPLLPLAGRARGGLAGRWPAAARRDLASDGRRAPRCSCCRSPPWSGSSSWPCWSSAVVRLLGDRPRGRPPPDPRPPGLAGVVDRCGCSTRRAPGCSRSTPAPSPRLAAGAGRPGRAAASRPRPCC